MSIGIGVIGGGGIASHHIRGYQQTDATIVMVSDVRPDVAQRRAAELDCAWCADYRELLARPDIDAVSVCVPNWLHYEVAAAAVEARKAVLCEKPMTVALEQAEDLVRRVRADGTYFQVAYMKRYHPVMRRFKEWLPRIGQIETGLLRSFQPFPEALWTAQDVWLCSKEKAGGGPLVHGGSHMLDLLHWYLGDVTALVARVRMKPGTEVDWHTGAIFEMASGSTVLFENGWFQHSNAGPKRDGWDEMLQLRGTRGILTVYPTFWDRPNAVVPWLELYTEESRTTEAFAYGPSDYFVEEIKDFVRRVADRQPPPVTVEDGCWVDRVIHSIYLSSEQEQRIELTL